MARNEEKVNFTRRALRDLSNSNRGVGRFSKSVKKAVVMEKKSKVKKQEDEAGVLDRLLLIQSDVSSLTSQIDELVAQSFNVKSTDKEGRKEIESFVHFLSDMLSSLKPWVPRLRKVLSGPSVGGENQSGQCLAGESVSVVNENENFEIESPEQSKMESLISPSPLVSWRAGCENERGRQLFLLTPLAIGKTLSLKRGPSRSAFERIDLNPTVDIQSFEAISDDVKDDLLMKATLSENSDSVVVETKSSPERGVVSTPMLSKKHCSVLVMTPHMKMSPPKSCVLLEPIYESSNKGNDKIRKSTPFPVGIHTEISESSGSEGSENLGFKFPELLGIQCVYKSRMGKKELEASPNWSFSPPKTCVLLEPPHDESLDIAPIDHASAVATVLNQQAKLKSLAHDIETHTGCHQIKNSHNPEPVSSTLVESTPIWKEQESRIRTGKRPGENTLKKELWTKFEAATTYGFRLNVPQFQGSAKKGFIDMLDEASYD
ncbi:hypothetical protein K2173_024445 [Erythroxylum novogranatense]|uniref:Uncharacterized protein n=1 Tax=Erythroxylum novogranatense TaxID=1862640 RepID=A0AAV8SV36_9ROSI|nr:hypothetical protein K2173_024445 [Erythroxylum novogranatense]